MNKFTTILCLLFCSCVRPSPQQHEAAKTAILQQAQERVNQVISQLRQDCDSSLLEMARYKADSIRRKGQAAMRTKMKQ